MNIRAGTSRWMTDRTTGIIHHYSRRKGTSFVEADCGEIASDEGLSDPKKNKQHIVAGTKGLEARALVICEECKELEEE